MSEKAHFDFKTDVKQLLELVTHSLYSHPEIFLRELISNASDAIDKIRFESLTHTDLLEEKDPVWKIKLILDAKKKTLTVSDNGCGMSQEELVENIGTIAKSGTKVFLQKLKGGENVGDMDFIGQFGVGFYSAFIVADKVVIQTRMVQEKGCQWVSEGKGSFEIEPYAKLTRGTEVILHLKKDYEQFLEEFTLRNIIKKYSDFIEHPIVMDVEKEEQPSDKDGKPDEKAKPIKKTVEEVLNSRKALWLKSKSQVSSSEYIEFYKQLSLDFREPLKTIHFQAEGTLEFKALLYIPSVAPLDIHSPDFSKGLQLYVNRVFIMEDCKKVIPEYLRFLKGVVEASDLPLNVSRELIQEDPRIEKIKKNVVRKVLGQLQEMMEQDREEYVTFYKEFGKVLKEGIHYDFDHRERIADILLFETTNTAQGEYRSLKEYIEDMKGNQKEIFYILAENRSKALSTPQLEMFREKEVEVLLLTDPVDNWIIGALSEYKKKALKPANQGDVDLRNKEEKKESEEEIKHKKEKFASLLGAIQEQLSEHVKEVRFSSRLKNSACCLVAEQGALNPQMEQMMKALGQTIPPQKKILEINPKHSIIEVLNSLHENHKEKFSDYIALLYDQALLTEGSPLPDPLAFAKRVSDLMVQSV